jgi:membrane-associated HD superfamily phosphohydrolase
MAEEIEGVKPVEPVTDSQIPEAKAEEEDNSKLLEALRKERERNKELAKKAKLADELEAKEAQRKDAELSEMEKLSKRLAEAELREKELVRKDLMRQAADKYGLPPALAKRLQGETLEELEADAEELAKEVPAPKQTAKVSATQVGGDAEPKETYAQQAYRIYHGSNVDPLDPKQAKELGGGVFLNTKTE